MNDSEDSGPGPLSDGEMSGVLRRIEKLLAIANDSRANPNEAAAAASQAEKIMRKYQVEHADVIAAQLKSKAGAVTSASVIGNMFRDNDKVPARVRNPSWAQHLAVALARLNDREVRQSTTLDKFGRYSACLTFFGFAPDVQVCRWMFDYLVGALIAGTKAWQAANRENYTMNGSAGKAEGHAYRTGFTTTLTARIYAQVADKQRDAITLATGTALVVAKQAAIEEAFGAFNYRESSSAQVRDASAMRDGMREARNVDLSRRGLGGNTSSVKRLASS